MTVHKNMTLNIRTTHIVDDFIMNRKTIRNNVCTAF